MSTRWALAAVAVLGLPLVALAAKGTLGYAADDYWQLCALEGRSYAGGPTRENLFRFWSGAPHDNLAAMAEGAVPWYADPELKVSFSRPLTTALHRLDHALFGANPTGAKLHGLLWYSLLVILVGRLFGRLLDAPAAALATLVFAMSGAHWQAVAWIAARNSTVTAVFAVGALSSHVAWREHGSRAALSVSVACMALGLAAGEATLGIVGYVVAYELFARPRPSLRSVATGMAPVALLACGWLFFYIRGGYGTFASGGYLDPIHEPLTFLARLPERLLAMTGMTFLGFPSDYWFLEPQTRPLAVACGAVALVFLAPLWTLARRDASVSSRRALAALALGCLISMVPQAAGFLGARSLTLPSLGGAALLGSGLSSSVRWLRARNAGGPPRWIVWPPVVIVAIVNLVLAPASWFASSYLYSRMTTATDANARALRFDTSTVQEVIAITAPDPFFGRYLPFQRRVLGLPTPQTWYTLSIAPYAHRITRTADDALELEVVGGELLQSPFEALMRHPGRRLRAGQAIDAGKLQARVLELGVHGPTRVAFRFDRSLDSPQVAVLAWRGGRMKSLPPLELGQAVLLPWVPGPTKL